MDESASLVRADRILELLNLASIHQVHEPVTTRPPLSQKTVRIQSTGYPFSPTHVLTLHVLDHNLCFFSPLAIFLNSSCGAPLTNLCIPPATSSTPFVSNRSMYGFLINSLIFTKLS